MAHRTFLKIGDEAPRTAMNGVDADVKRIVPLKRESDMARETGPAVGNAVQDVFKAGGAFVARLAISRLGSESRGLGGAHLKSGNRRPIQSLASEDAARLDRGDVGSRQSVLGQAQYYGV